MIHQASTSNNSSSLNLSEELFYTIAFSMLKGIPESHKLKMLRHFSSAHYIFKISSSTKNDWPLNPRAAHAPAIASLRTEPLHFALTELLA